MMKKSIFIQFVIIFSCIVNLNLIFSQEQNFTSCVYKGQEYLIYPHEYSQNPRIQSPFTSDDSKEFIVVQLKNSRYALIPVTVENGSPLLYSYRIDDLFGKDKQLQIDSGDFPTLARTGLHSGIELDSKKMITGFPLSLITYIGRPGRFSDAGFMAADEDILSVLKGDNSIVQKLGLSHPRMARPLFHVWNLILKVKESGRFTRFWDNIPYLYYNDGKIKLDAEGGKGWQISIFQDEIKGRFNINVKTDLTGQEQQFLLKRYSYLNQDQLNELEQKLTHIHFSEMAPYYIMRYGFYEGHTKWRTDPIAIAFVFGLKSLEDIDDAFEGRLYDALTNHFAKEKD